MYKAAKLHAAGTVDVPLRFLASLGFLGHPGSARGIFYPLRVRV
ncbi:hypothetical protein E2C01_059261 [Portunus trituberculatus]|uniref:Uncharacterized protein n=1 Tax=Portunus trituberculatus TaxID=210409 RepID=A0A5B7H4V8_PORTR|nr:hypothetical protein [Portunus trituberculatus]